LIKENICLQYRDGEKKARKRGRGGVVEKDLMELVEIRGEKYRMYGGMSGLLRWDGEGKGGWE
jgi:hypothetical protein